MNEMRDKWDARYRGQNETPAPCMLLQERRDLLPTGGAALDLACGRGGNALLLAQAGLQVTAWDLSPVAIEQLQSHAQRLQLSIRAEVRDVIAAPPAANRFDLIVVSYFLERGLAPALLDALRPGGRLFYQTFGPERVDGHGPVNPAYRLRQDEMLELFAPLATRFYRDAGLRGEIMYVGEKPTADRGES